MNYLPKTPPVAGLIESCSHTRLIEVHDHTVYPFFPFDGDMSKTIGRSIAYYQCLDCNEQIPTESKLVN